MPPSPSKMGGDENFRKQSNVGMGGHKTLISRRGVNFLGKGSKDLSRKRKLHNLNYTDITFLKLRKICLFRKYTFFIIVNM